MTTKNIRTVGYLPPALHQQLREYMAAHSLTESAALVQIVKQFFNAQPDSASADLSVRDRDLDPLKTEIAGLKQRLEAIEATISSPRRSSVRHSNSQYSTPPTLPPQTLPELARRLGVGTETLAEAAGKGEAYFRDWSQHRDPAKRAWVERDGRFHPL
jgi:hypothetical protein